MRKLLLASMAFCALSLNAQTTIFSDDFESGTANWTLGGTGDNSWVVNNSYTGFSTLITDTPNEPGNIQTNYLHITNGTVCGGLSVCNANFDTGSTSNTTADATALSTTGMNTVTIAYIYLCSGQTGTSYGTLEYSVDGGSTWNIQATYSGISTWTTENQTNAAWDNQADLRFRFRWQNGAAGSDPAFSVDNLVITAISSASPTITTASSIFPLSWCYNTAQNLLVDFTSTGTFTSGNTYTAELSDASGSFASPLSIGTLSSTANSGTISATVPAGIAVGSGYRIRVVSSSPAVTGTDNGIDLTIHTPPTVTLSAFSDVCVYNDPFTLTGGSPASGTFSGTGVTLNVFNPNTAGLGTHTITYTYTDGNGCSGSAQQSIVVDACAGLNELTNTVVIYPNPVSNNFKISGISNIEKVEVYDMSGKKIKSFNNTDATYNVSDLSNGYYLIKVLSVENTYLQQLYIRR